MQSGQKQLRRLKKLKSQRKVLNAPNPTRREAVFWPGTTMKAKRAEVVPTKPR